MPEDQNTTQGQPQVGSDVLFVLDELAPGAIIERGDLLLVVPADPRSLTSMDNGKLMGLRVAGCEVQKAGAWYRPRWTNEPLGPARHAKLKNLSNSLKQSLDSRVEPVR